MTDKTDIPALKRPVRDRYDWSSAVWRDCDQCGKQHTGTVTAEDGSQICSHCADQLYWSAWQVLAERALEQLETERQQREAFESAAFALRDEMRNQQKRAVLAEKERDALKSAHGNMVTRCALLRQRTDLPVDRIPAYSSLVKAQEENAALKAKLANPVVLPEDLHPQTAKLVINFASALAEKLHKAEQKYGYSDTWMQPHWQIKCLDDFKHHVSKGDPRDVAAYCAFMWYHGWSTAVKGE